MRTPLMRLPRTAASALSLAARTLCFPRQGDRVLAVAAQQRPLSSQSLFVAPTSAHTDTQDPPQDTKAALSGVPEFLLSEIAPKDLAAVARGRSLNELLPMVVTLIDVRRLELAETLFVSIVKYQAQDWKRYSDPSIYNMFLQAYLHVDDDRSAAKWRDALFERGQVSPDALTYAILLKHCLLLGATSEFHQLCEQMAIDGVTVESVFELEYLKVQEKRQIYEVLGIKSSPTAEPAPVDCSPYLFPGFSHAGAARGKPVIRNLDKLPEVFSIQSKSDGISFLKDSLKILCQDPTTDMYIVQEQLERDCFAATTRRIGQELENYKSSTNATPYTSKMKKLIATWHTTLTQHIKDSLASSVSLCEDAGKTTAVSKGSKIFYGAILSALEPPKISLICLQELTRSNSYTADSRGVSVARLSGAIGSALEREIFALQISKKEFLKHTKLAPKNLARIFHNRSMFEATMRKQYANLEHNIDAIRDGWIPRWSKKLRCEIGVYVASLAIESLNITDSAGIPVPAFHHRIVPAGRQSVGMVCAHPELFRLMTVEPAPLFVEPWAMPMLVPPKPWITCNSGGYLTQKNICVRLKDDPVHLAVINQADKEGSMQKILFGLDVLGQTAWRINERILKVALQMWNSGINVATLEKPKQVSMPGYRPKDSFESHEAYVSYVRQAVECRENMNKAHSNMCDTNYKLEIARQFSGLVFYLPHSVDFRGRAYPIPPHLSHVGSDISRGLLVFAEGRALGKSGLRWLKIQLANMAGYDKASLDERVAFADQNISKVYDSADDPLDGGQWWRQADEPWQCLATCIELAAALRSPDPEEYISHLPCQQDGSCNGLQHYAAMGCDVDGARQVNLSSTPRPQDVYAAVARLVAAQVEKDSLTANHIAAKLVGKISRKIVKQTVMTNVYGVTRYGARQQIEGRLKEFNVVASEDLKEARKYLAESVFKSLGTLFEKAQLIQQWLTETANEISRAVPPEVAAKFGSAANPEFPTILGEHPQGRKSKEWLDVYRTDPADRYPQTSVFWTTPTGFQVVQPYLKNRQIQLRTVLQSLSLQVSSKFDPVDATKQASAFPPNFVHSLDASHMFMTALACHKEGITFASVHDCFWTHASTVDLMSRVLREEFVKMHSEPILEKLRCEFLERYRGYVVPTGLAKFRSVPTGDIRHISVKSWRPIQIPPLPPKGDFDIKQVLQSDYFFS